MSFNGNACLFFFFSAGQERSLTFSQVLCPFDRQLFLGGLQLLSKNKIVPLPILILAPSRPPTVFLFIILPLTDVVSLIPSSGSSFLADERLILYTQRPWGCSLPPARCPFSVLRMSSVWLHFVSLVTCLLLSTTICWTALLVPKAAGVGFCHPLWFCPSVYSIGWPWPPSCESLCPWCLFRELVSAPLLTSC